MNLSRQPYLVIALLLAVMIGGCALRDGNPAPASDRSAANPPASARDAADVLQMLTAAWGSGNAAAAAALAPDDNPIAARQLALVARNARALDLRDLTIVSDQGAPAAPATGRLGWQLPGEPGTNTVPISFTWGESANGLALAAVTGSERTPLWLVDQLRIARSPGVTIVASANADLVEFRRTAERARGRVRQVFANWTGRLTVEIPSSQEVLGRVLGGGTGAYDGIAAVTTSSDGSRTGTAAPHVFVNPEAYATMDAVAAEIVMAHEAVHVATRAPTVAVPMWWSEGVAEYIAFGGMREGTGSAKYYRASQQWRSRARAGLVDRLRADGPPDSLPLAQDFAGSGREAAYESARVACEVLAALVPSHPAGGAERSFASFQRALARRVGTDAALRRVFGISRQAFVTSWRAELSRLAG
ncbi:MAG: hypothetical protein ACRCYU_05155 [Nocardioides sp.]